MKRSILTAIATLILATSLQAKYKDDKIAKDDIPRNEKKLWMRIDETQEKLESSLLSGDQRFLDQLELARKKVADIMLTAEDEKKNRAAVKRRGLATDRKGPENGQALSGSLRSSSFFFATTES